MLTIGVVHKGVDLVGVDKRENRHQPRQPEEPKSAENSDTIVAGTSILSVVPLVISPRPPPPPPLDPTAGVVIKGAEVTDQRVLIPAGVAYVHDEFTPFVCESLVRGPAGRRIVIMATT